MDDGKEPAKRAWVAQVNSPRLKYITRCRPANEINGKAGNLNNALRLMYPPGADVPMTEVRRVPRKVYLSFPTAALSTQLALEMAMGIRASGHKA